MPSAVMLPIPIPSCRCACSRVGWQSGAAAGFALLEVLVAFVIAAMALSVLSHAAFSGLNTLRAASRYEQAVSRARSHLAMAVHTDPLVAGDWHGDDGAGFTWNLRVTPVESTTIRPVNTLTLRGSSVFPLTLYAVGVQITWREGRATRNVGLETWQIGQGVR
jgi:general secretion pathway protein I